VKEATLGAPSASLSLSLSHGLPCRIEEDDTMGLEQVAGPAIPGWGG
jgi:hypothetical protein